MKNTRTNQEEHTARLAPAAASEDADEGRAEGQPGPAPGEEARAFEPCDGEMLQRFDF